MKFTEIKNFAYLIKNKEGIVGFSVSKMISDRPKFKK